LTIKKKKNVPFLLKKMNLKSVCLLVGAGKKKIGKVFTTSFVDANLDSRFISCYTMSAVPKNMWTNKEPNNKDYKEAVVGFIEDSFEDYSIHVHFHVVCEVRVFHNNNI
jgi:hypothetical protein